MGERGCFIGWHGTSQWFFLLVVYHVVKHRPVRVGNELPEPFFLSFDDMLRADIGNRCISQDDQANSTSYLMHIIVPPKTRAVLLAATIRVRVYRRLLKGQIKVGQSVSPMGSFIRSEKFKPSNQGIV